ncbi:glycosyltransferase family A protein [Chromobacterium amazonense]|uniref:Glycosyltransferase family A protein n=1 Tax=Chromobacterium amazonense TaxID=1382803 RepID=A0ABU8UXA6_9NEIS|nr:glycosyltransferase family A protein [Chromobacterium amazonense]MDQ4539182.1 glycosyltransferase family A protein [Chromobacterium amazonense]
MNTVNTGNKDKTSLFSVANRMYREKNYEGAIAAYEILEEENPSIPLYKQNNESARSKLSNSAKHSKKLGNQYHLENSSEFQKRLRVSHFVSEIGDPELIDACFTKDRDPQIYLAKANATAQGNYLKWLEYVNSYLSSNDMSKISLKEIDHWVGSTPYLNIIPAKLEKVDGPLVTICMTCFNAEEYVEHAVRSVLAQSYQSIELLIFNDCSTDGSLGILRKLEKEDARIRIIDNKTNQGTYTSRNQAFQIAKGEFFTVLDADDFALPERISKQVHHLIEHKNHIGMLTEWVRMSLDGKFHFKTGWGGLYQHEAVATLMVRTKFTREKAGYWDSVRFGADSEYMNRLRRIFGESSIPLVKIPTTISLFHENSLTNDPITGIAVNGMTGFSPARSEYLRKWKDWHKKNGKNLYLKFPLSKDERPFSIPDEMYP